MAVNPPSTHTHTWLKLSKDNGGALSGGALVMFVSAVLLGVQKGLTDHTLVLPPGLEAYAPWLLLIVGAALVAIVQSGVPAFHPGQSQTGAPKLPPVVHLPNEPPAAGG